MNDFLIYVAASHVAVAVSRFYFDHFIADIQYGDVKGSAAEVVHNNLFVLFLIKSIGKSCRGWLINDALNVEPRDFPCIFCRFALCVIKICRHSDNRFCNRLAEFLFSIALQFLQNHGGNLFRSIVFAGERYEDAAVWSFFYFVRHRCPILLHLGIRKTVSDEALDAVDSILRISYRLTSRKNSH